MNVLFYDLGIKVRFWFYRVLILGSYVVDVCKLVEGRDSEREKVNWCLYTIIVDRLFYG